MSYIRFDKIEKSFDKKRVLNSIDISIAQGEFVTLLGPSGCGKTTLLRCLAGLEKVDAGRIYIDGRDMTSAMPKDREVSMIFQQYSLFPTMTVYKNIAFGLKMKRLENDQICDRVAEALKMVDLEGSAQKYPAQLSGGEQQRVALARSIVTKAKVLLLDEPFSAIDAKLRKSLQVKIREIHDALGMTTVFVTHDQEEALRMSDRIYLMNGGYIEQAGPPMDLYMYPKTTFAAGFMGHCNMLSQEEYARLTGMDRPIAGVYAIRPENIRIQENRNEPENSRNVYIHGVVQRIIPQGNFIRYTVLAGGILLDVDTLFTDNAQYVKNSQVLVSFDKDMVLHFSKT